MATELKVTLLTDGTSDRVLRHPIRWLFADQGKHVEPRWVDPTLYQGRASGLHQRIAIALKLYPCDLLIVHRDAENQVPSMRAEEIAKSAARAHHSGAHVCLVPIRMTDRDLGSIFHACTNPRGCHVLQVFIKMSSGLA